MAGIWTMGELLVEIMRPKAGMELSETGTFLGPYPSGAPAIFIDTAARLGHTTGIIGGVGRDDFGRCLLKRLQADGVNVRFVEEVTGGSTAVAFVTYFEDGERNFIFHIDGTPAVLARFPGDGLEEELKDAPPGFFHVMGCSLMANDRFRKELFKAVDFFHHRGTRISFDPNIRPELLGSQDVTEVTEPVLKHSAVLLPGVTEIKLLSGQGTVEKALETLFDNPVLQTVVLKRGKAGATVYTRHETVDIAAYPVDEVDPTGAGDCFDAGFLCGLLEGKSLHECGQIAAAAGALNASAFGPMEGRISPETLRKTISP